MATPSPRDSFQDTIVWTNPQTGILYGLEDVRVVVYVAGTKELATLYTNNGDIPGLQFVKAVNPITTTRGGAVRFYADVGQYEISVEDEQQRITNYHFHWNAVNTSPGGISLSTLGESVQRQLAQVGQVIDWWRPEATVALPSGWEVCDGRTIAATAHDFGTGKAFTLPDLRNAFILGASVNNADGSASSNGDGTSNPLAFKTDGTTPDLIARKHPNAPGIGGTGGSNASVNLGHTHEFSHYHGFTAPNHTHSGVTTPHEHGGDTLYTGDHNHSVPESGTASVGPLQYDATPDPNPTYLPNLHHTHTTATLHNIGIYGTVTAAGLGFKSGTANESLVGNTATPNTTTTQDTGTLSTTADLRPKHVGLLKLMKVKRN